MVFGEALMIVTAHSGVVVFNRDLQLPVTPQKRRERAIYLRLGSCPSCSTRVIRNASTRECFRSPRQEELVAGV
jgi:hypothetical protein